MFLRDQGIDDNDGVVDRVRQARGLSDDGGDVGRGGGIYDVLEGSETSTEASSI